MVDTDDGDGEATTSEEDITRKYRNAIFGTRVMHRVRWREASNGEVSGDEDSDDEEHIGQIR